MDKQNLMILTALSYVITDIRVHLFTLINLLVEKGVISAKEYEDMQKKCEVAEGAAALKEIQSLIDKILKEDGEH